MDHLVVDEGLLSTGIRPSDTRRLLSTADGVMFFTRQSKDMFIPIADGETVQSPLTVC